MFPKPSGTEEQGEGLCWGRASGETEAQVGRKEAPFLRISVLRAGWASPGQASGRP